MADDWKNAPIVSDWETAEVVEPPEQQGKTGEVSNKPQLKSEETAKNLRIGTYNDPRGALLTAGSSVLGSAFGGIAGLVGGAVGALGKGGETGTEKANKWLEKTRDFITIDPPNQASERALDSLANAGEKVSRGASSIPAALASFSEQDDLLAAQEFNKRESAMGEENFKRIVDEGALKYAGGETLEATGSPALATVVEVAPQAIAMLLGARAMPKKAKTPKPTTQKVPTIEELKTESRALYDLVDESGVGISDSSFATAVDKITSDAMSKGARQSLTPKTWAALEELKAEAQAGGLTLKKSEELRRVIKKAQNAADPADMASATRALSQWDNYVGSLGAKDLSSQAGKQTAEYLKAARQLWSRSRKAEVIDDLIDKAQLNAGYFTGSGYENALRSQFRSLARNNKKMRMFTKEEQAAIRKVAVGGPVENILRYAGKLAPTGVVSGGISAGAGFALGGPAGAVALPAAGAVARKLATRSTIKNAEKASEVMRKEPAT